MVRFIDQHRTTSGVESICRQLPIAPSTYFRHKARQADPSKRSARAIRDEVLMAIIARIWREHDHAYGAHKVWKQMGREGLREARCRVRRLMRALGLRGVVRGRAWTTTTHPDTAAPRPADLVQRQFTATRPNQLWVSDFTYVATWNGFVYVAFVIDVFARRIVGWRVSSSLRVDFVLDALEQAIYARCDDTVGDLVHHSDRGSQGEFNRSLQQLRKEKLQWGSLDDVGLIVLGAARSAHPGVRRQVGVNIDKRFGRASRAGYRAGTRHWKQACRNRSVRGGSARMAVCRRPTWRRCQGGICRLWTVKRSRC